MINHKQDKRTISARILAGVLIILAILALSACDNFLNPPKAHSASSNIHNIHFSVDSSVVRTIGYSVPGIDQYILKGGLDQSSSELARWSAQVMSQGANLALEAGTWSFSLEALNGQGNVVLRGVLSEVVIGGPDSLAFTLTPLTSGTGTVDVKLVWPLSSPVSSVEILQDSQLISSGLIPQSDPSTGTCSVHFLDNAVAAGNTLLVFRLLDDDGDLVATVTEILWVRGNLLSSKTIELTEDNLNSPPEAPSLLTAQRGANLTDLDSADVQLSWQDNSFLETGFLIQSSLDGGSTWQSAGETEASMATADLSAPRGEGVNYRVCALNQYGQSPWVTFSVITIPWLVQFDSGEGSTVDSQEVLPGELITQPDDPSRLLYTFQFWTTDTEGTAPWDFSTDPVGENVVLHAQWEEYVTPATDFQYNISGGEVTIVSYLGTGPVVVIPETIEGYPVTSIIDGINSTTGAFCRRSDITAVYIPGSVKSVGKYSFYFCSALETVVLGEGVETLGTSSFALCSGLESFSLPASITSFADGYNSFVGNSYNIQSFQVDPGNSVYSSQDGVLFDKAQSRLILYPPAKADLIYRVPSSVTTVANGSFRSCEYLTELEFSQGIQTMESSAVANCYDLERVYIPASMTSFTTPAFSYCSGLSNIEVDPANSAYSSYGGAIYNKEQTRLISLPNGLDPAVYSYPSSLDTISTYAFTTFSSLIELTIPTGITNIETNAVWFCNALEDLYLPNTITNLEGYAFRYCDALSNIHVANTTPPVLGGAALASNVDDDLTVWVPQGSLSLYLSAGNWGGSSMAAFLRESGSPLDFSAFEAGHYAQMVAMSSKTSVSAGGFLLDKDGGNYYQEPHATYSENGFFHDITPFEMGQYEVTYYLWDAVYDWAVVNGYSFANPGDYDYNGTNVLEPVMDISWRDALVWCNAFTEYRNTIYGDSLDLVYFTDGAFTTPLRASDSTESINATPGSCDNPYVNWDAKGYRLPTEGEWQFAASCGGTYGYNYASGADAPLNDTPLSDIDGDGDMQTGEQVAWNWYSAFRNGSSDPDYGDHPVAELSANCWGLYDMSGNIDEWCWDWYAPLPTAAQENYRGPATGSEKESRGGWWASEKSYDFNVAHRYIDQSPDRTSFNTSLGRGFRLARTE